MNRSTTITVLAALILGIIINSVFVVNDKAVSYTHLTLPTNREV